MTVQESDHRLGELILYISQRSVNDVYFGAVKLNKILFYSDFLAYGQWGKSITGADYCHRSEGPAPLRLVQVRQQLLDRGDLAIQTVNFPGGKKQQRPIHLREPDLSLFNGNQTELVREVIKDLGKLTAKQVSDLTHEEWGWKLTAEGEIIDYDTIFLSPDAPSEAEKNRAVELLREDGYTLDVQQAVA